MGRQRALGSAEAVPPLGNAAAAPPLGNAMAVPPLGNAAVGPQRSEAAPAPRAATLNQTLNQQPAKEPDNVTWRGLLRLLVIRVNKERMSAITVRLLAETGTSGKPYDPERDLICQLRKPDALKLIHALTCDHMPHRALGPKSGGGLARNGECLALAELLTSYWRAPVSEELARTFFVVQRHQRLEATSAFWQRNGARPWPPACPDSAQAGADEVAREEGVIAAPACAAAPAAAPADPHGELDLDVLAEFWDEISEDLCAPGDAEAAGGAEESSESGWEGSGESATSTDCGDGVDDFDMMDTDAHCPPAQPIFMSQFGDCLGEGRSMSACLAAVMCSASAADHTCAVPPPAEWEVVQEAHLANCRWRLTLEADGSEDGSQQMEEDSVPQQCMGQLARTLSLDSLSCYLPIDDVEEWDCSPWGPAC